MAVKLILCHAIKSRRYLCSAFLRANRVLFVSLFCIMCRESLPPDTSTKARFAAEQAPFRVTELFIRVTLSWVGRPPRCVGGTLSRLRTQSFAAMTNEEKKCHNSLLDINDP